MRFLKTKRLAQLVAVVLAVTLFSGEALAFRMIQNTGVGTFHAGARVRCNDRNGFVHWAATGTTWRLNTQLQGSGKATAVQNALGSWTNVTPATYVLSYGGTTTAGLNGTDGQNTLIWKPADGLCGGSCLAVTCITLASGQVLTDSDIQFNNGFTWNTNGSDYDTEAIAAHEVGHGMGIHHTEKQRSPLPTMYAFYFGTGGRSLESDDAGALNCAFDKYPPTLAAPAEQSKPGSAAGSGQLALAARPGRSGAVLRYSLPAESDVRIDIYNVAGRRVLTLVEGRRAAGDHEVAWNGATARGQAPSGVYYALVSTPRGDARTKLVLLH
jgi:hypothetical protein